MFPSETNGEKKNFHPLSHKRVNQIDEVVLKRRIEIMKEFGNHVHASIQQIGTKPINQGKGVGVNFCGLDSRFCLYGHSMLY